MLNSILTLLLSFLTRLKTMFSWLSRFKRNPDRRQAQPQAYCEFAKQANAPYDPASTLHVVAVYFNHQRFQNPKKNFMLFKAYMERQPNVVFHIVELALRDMPFEVTEVGNPHHVRLKTEHELFHKENLVNIGVRKSVNALYPDWKFMAWVDADVKFTNNNFVADTIRQCNRFEIVQMWADAIDLGPDHKPLRFKVKKAPNVWADETVVTSFAYCYRNMSLEYHKYAGATAWHPGYAWAMRREVWDKLDGLLDISILGAGDHHMAWAFVGKPYQGIHGAASQAYKDECWKWLANARDVVKGSVGYTDGMLMHFWHGRKGDRKYVERWDILVRNKYNPKTDLTRTPDGLLQLTDRSPQLRRDIQRYFEQRNEDANTLT